MVIFKEYKGYYVNTQSHSRVIINTSKLEIWMLGELIENFRTPYILMCQLRLQLVFVVEEVLFLGDIPFDI